ncbi:MAG TPA: VWA domain-containing protein, partial [Urbifossiella sp.]
MTFLKRLRILTAVLGVAGASAAIVSNLFGDVRDRPGSTAPSSDIRPDGHKVIDELAVTKFSQHPAITYQVRSGETLFAWQIKPALDAAPARPRDILVMVDTSASQAGKPLQQARQIIQGLAGTLSGDDRLSVWTLSTPAATRALTKDFQAPASEDVKTAATTLTEVEYGSGATDLKGGLAKGLATLAPNRGRHQMVLLLGDGDSAFDPLSEDDRIAIGAQMDTNNVFFFAVPLGIKVNPANLHGLATLTGGAVVRVQEDLADETKRGEFLGRLKTAIDVPVLKSDKVKFCDEIAEIFPAKLPPLRTDKPTLVMGKLARPTEKVTAAITGKASGGKPVSLALAQDLPPSQIEHFFLNMMIDQWRDAPHKDAPAMLQADRALALASTQVGLYRDEFLTQANWAITMDRLDEAAKLFAAAKRIDPNDAEANAGISLVDKMKTGRLTKAELEKKITTAKEGLKIDAKSATKIVFQEIAKQEPKDVPPAPPAPAAPGGALPPAAIDRIRETEALRRVEEQRYRVLVDSTIRRSRQLLRVDPDQAYLDLKRQRDEILSYGGIGDESRNRLAADITAVMDEIFRKGAEIKRTAAVEREQIAKTRQKLNEFDRQQAEEDRTKARIDSFKQLMQQARFELAYQEAQNLIHERISKGQGVPPAVTASYIIGQQATQLREWKELVRIRDDRFLLTMMQAEKSHIPYPDEPPVHFPPAAVWRELTGNRKEKYENSILGADAPETQKKIRTILGDNPFVPGPRVSYEKDLTTTPFKEVLEDLAKKYDITFVVNKTAIGDMANTLDTAKAEKLSVTKLDGMPVGTFLDVYLKNLPIPYITYVVRPDFIEITSYDARMEEKVTRVFPVADLVIPIPQAVNQSTLYQNLGVQQQTLAIYGQSSLYGGALNSFIGAGGGNNNNANGPAGAGGGQGGNRGNLFNQNGGGGIVGLGGTGGNQQGQFGNLGGQFGLQGGTQERFLIQLILDTVAKGEWEQSRQAPPENPDEPPP